MSKNKMLNTVSEFRSVDVKRKFIKNREKNILGSSLERKIESVNREIDKMKTDEILLNVDPEVDSIEAIEQIQNYYELIKKEISKINKRVTQEKELEKEILSQEEKMEQLFKPKKINYSFSLTAKNFNSNEFKITDKPKPVIDYGIKIRNLKHEIHLTSQNYNDTKAKNEILRHELDELRKSIIVRKDKIDHMFKELLQIESEFIEEKRKIEIELDKRKIDLSRDIDQKTYDLAEKNKDMIEKMKANDEKITKIYAKKKHIEHERIKLKEKEQNIIQTWKWKNEEFFHGKQEQINKLNNNDDTNKVLDTLSGEKANQLREIVNKLYDQDSDEDDITKITRLLEYFINSTKEFKNHEDFILALQIKVNELEKEVDELEHIINFFENNLEIKHEEKVLNEEDEQKLGIIKKNIETLLNMQYHVLVEKYKDYCDNIRLVFNEIIPTIFENNIDFCEFSKKMFGKFQDLIKGCLLKINTNNIGRSNQIKFSSTRETRMDQLSAIELEFKEKSEKIRAAAKTFYEKSGAKLSIDNIRGLVTPVIFNEDKKKKK